MSTTAERIEALRILRDHGIPTVVWLTPTLPFINDTAENLSYLLQACVECQVKGIITFGFGLTLREGDREYFFRALDKHFPGMKQRYASTYGNAYMLPSPNEKELMAMLKDTCTRHQIMYRPDDSFHYMQTFPQNEEQLSMLDLMQ